jgi:hypothetical protein
MRSAERSPVLSLLPLALPPLLLPPLLLLLRPAQRSEELLLAGAGVLLQLAGGAELPLS